MSGCTCSLRLLQDSSIPCADYPLTVRREYASRYSRALGKGTLPTATELPADLLIAVFQHLDMDTKLRAQSVCRLWYSILSNSVLQAGPRGDVLRYAV